MRDIPFLFSMVGSSGSGKTTLIIKIIKYLSAKGFCVGAVKRSHHLVEVDKEGKDSLRFRQAGANPTVLLNDHFFAYMEKTEAPLGLEDVASNFAGKADIVVVEGFKTEGAIAKFLFVESPVKDIGELIKYENVLGFITDSMDAGNDSILDKPLLHRDDIKTIAEIVIELMNK